MEIIRKEQSFSLVLLVLHFICYNLLVATCYSAAPSSTFPPFYPFLSLIFLISLQILVDAAKYAMVFTRLSFATVCVSLLLLCVWVFVYLCVFSANISRRIFIGCQGIKSDSNWSQSLPKRFTKCFPPFPFLFLYGLFSVYLDWLWGTVKNFRLGISQSGFLAQKLVVLSTNAVLYSN